MKTFVLAFCLLSAVCVVAGQSNVPAGTIAVLFGTSIPASDKEGLSARIVSSLMESCIKENKLTASAKEQDAFLKDFEARELEMETSNDKLAEDLRKELASGKLSASERKEKETALKGLESLQASKKEIKETTKGMEAQLRPVMLEMAKSSVLAWKVNKFLYAKYGGRVIFQQSGPEPLDAWREFLKAEEKKGSFKILDKDCEASFWRYYTDDSMHTFYPKEEGSKFIETPWWLNRIQPSAK